MVTKRNIAPNGKPSRLSPSLYALVRTAAFKKWFGDWELASMPIEIVTAKKEHGFKRFADARRWAKENVVGCYHNQDIGEVVISKTSIDKFLSEKAVAKSDNIDIHLSALREIGRIIEHSIIGETHMDKKNDVHLRDIVRLYGVVSDGGHLYRAKTTIKRYQDRVSSKAYSYEITQLELIDVELGNEITHSPNSSTNSIIAAKLLNGVENNKGTPLINTSVIVDENGEPLVVEGKFVNMRNPYRLSGSIRLDEVELRRLVRGLEKEGYDGIITKDRIIVFNPRKQLKTAES